MHFLHKQFYQLIHSSIHQLQKNLIQSWITIITKHLHILFSLSSSWVDIFGAPTSSIVSYRLKFVVVNSMKSVNSMQFYGTLRLQCTNNVCNPNTTNSFRVKFTIVTCTRTLDSVSLRVSISHVPNWMFGPN